MYNGWTESKEQTEMRLERMRAQAIANNHVFARKLLPGEMERKAAEALRNAVEYKSRMVGE